MRLYRVHFPIDNKTHWKRTLGEAGALLKDIEPFFRPGIKVQLMEVPTDAESMVRLANEGFDAVAKELRVWQGTRRGGLKEITDGVEQTTEKNEPEEPPAPTQTAGEFWSTLESQKGKKP